MPSSKLFSTLTDPIQTMTTYIRNDSDASSGGSAGHKKEASDGIEMVPTNNRQVEPSGPLKLTEANSIEKTGYMFPTRKKWMILTVVGLCQTSMSK
jgi:hypothetical protein